MTSKKIKVSDLEIILHLFAPKNYNLYLFDPFGRLIEDKPFGLANGDQNHPKVLVNLSKKIICYKGMPLDSFDFILDFGQSKMPIGYQTRQYQFMNNSQGGMRWIYRKGQLTTALSFYNTSSTRSKAISTWLKFLNDVKLGALVSSGSFAISTSQELKLDILLKEVSHDTYAIFTGTSGYDRTAVIAIEKKGAVTHFAKVALNKHGINLLSNEKLNLQSKPVNKFQSIIVPRTLKSQDQAFLITTNEGNNLAKNIGELTSQHINALVEMFNVTKAVTKIDGSTFWENIIGNLNLIQAADTSQVIKECSQLMIRLQKEINSSDRIVTSLAHSDFTPWNTQVMEDKLYIYDWEMAMNNVPALFDLFHFHFQNGIMVHKSSLKDILSEINKSCQESQIKGFINNFNIDISFYLKLYLLRTASYYLATFTEQNFITREQLDQISIWTQAIRMNLSTAHVLSHRKVFIQEFYTDLRKYKHAMLKFDCKSLDALPETADLDIAVLKKDCSNISNFCNNHQLIQRTKILKKSFMMVIQLFFKDGSFLSIDLIHQFKRKGLEMMKISPLLNSAYENRHNVLVPSTPFDLEYAFLFYNLNNSSIPIRYYHHFSDDSLSVMQKGMDHLNEKYNLNIKSFQDLFTGSKKLRNKIKSIVKKQQSVSLWRQIIHPINYIIDSFKSMISNPGFIVTLSGVDGVGKSTIVKEVHKKMALKYRKEVVLLRHRPGLLPILSSFVHGSIEAAEKAAGENIPRQGTNNNFLSSILRFSYYYTDYIIGQIYIYFKYILRGKVVLYDRYYFDFISDSKRSNIRLSRSLIKHLYHFILKPRISFLLWADSAEVYKRKQELNPKTISRLTANYKSLFIALESQFKNSKYIAVENVKIDETVDKIMNEFSQVA